MKSNATTNAVAFNTDNKIIAYPDKITKIFDDIILLFKHLPENTHQQNSQNFYAARCVEIRQQQKSKSTTNNRRKEIA
tara:strand:- start:201 stop:434 length:234 start_codon:yes stop_codon:yes gene_type:complete